ncbi:nitrilase-related carbon-nitrogen hydrolase [Aquibacillus sediminis]|uniref:nitrilase-related carbon-nitrogen hydrolase n=1 Tax=Aquibacillus sediminis TaxID=2574734 RepID=UPI00110A07D3|nr:nitrilase-related carbon-nitrogen hydrolase [Aquibacillus sediminis]
MNTNYKVAAIQFEPTQFEKDYNIGMLYQMVEEAARSGAKLIVTPEMGTTGYCWYNREEVAPFVESIPGKTTNQFEELATRYNIYIVIGLPEVDLKTNLYYNSAVLIGPKGLIGKHRKTHPYISEPKWAASGDIDHPVFDTEIGKISLLICMDIHFIETARLVALRGTDVICHISNWLAERTPAPYWINRAYENQCYLIESNRWGYERTVQFSGGSCVISPDGHVQGYVDKGDGIFYGEVDLAESRKNEISDNSILFDRRPEKYMELMTNTFMWNPLDFFGLYGNNPLPKGKKSRISVAQMEVTSNVEVNVEKILDLTVEAKQNGAELVVFPELSISGPFQPESAETILGPSVESIVHLSIKHKIYIVSGFVEVEGSSYYNTAILTGPEGFIGKYRKMHLNTKDKEWATPGEKWETFDLPIGRVGMLVGYDAMFPETGRVLSLLGSDLIVCPSAIDVPITSGHVGTDVEQNYPIPTGADPLHWHFYRVRAGENNVYLAFSNALDDDMKISKGRSGVFGPDTFHFPRNESVLFGEEGVAIIEMDTTNEENTTYPTNVVRRKDLVLMRQPHLYKDLIRTTNTDNGLVINKL